MVVVAVMRVVDEPLRPEHLQQRLGILPRALRSRLYHGLRHDGRRTRYVRTTMHYYAPLCAIMRYYALLCTTMRYHALLCTRLPTRKRGHSSCSIYRIHVAASRSLIYLFILALTYYIALCCVVRRTHTHHAIMRCVARPAGWMVNMRGLVASRVLHKELIEVKTRSF
eukprot:COSAG06_NODE_5274_length_3593_cov_25.942187_8_plen_168_part_00